jgi:hypothetical protein
VRFKSYQANLILDVELENAASVVERLITVRSPGDRALVQNVGKLGVWQTKIIDTFSFSVNGIQKSFGNRWGVYRRQKWNSMRSTPS